MARLDDLVAQVADPSLKQEMEVALREMKRRQRFGLVFAEHIPETMALYGLPIQAGSLVQKRDNPQARVLLGATPSVEDPLLKSERVFHCLKGKSVVVTTCHKSAPTQKGLSCQIEFAWADWSRCSRQKR